MRRYRFGRIAAPLAAGYVAVVVSFGVVALTTGDATLLRRLVAEEWWRPFGARFTWQVELLLVAFGAVQGWAIWQVLRGRAAGALTHRGRRVGLLRAALYANVAFAVVFRLPIPHTWWTGVLGSLVQMAVVWLYFLVLARVLPWRWRLLSLLAGTIPAVTGMAGAVAYEWGPDAPFLLSGLGEPFWLLWLVTVLAGQARDPRWSRTTVWIGAIWGALWFLTPTSSAYVTYSSLAVSHVELLHMTMGALMVSGLVWEARSAHELAGPLPAVARVAPERVTAPPWPFAALAVVLPLVPAAVNLAVFGDALLVGPGGGIDDFLTGMASLPTVVAWLAFDMLVGVGAPAVLVLIAVAVRTRRLLRVTTWALCLAAVAGVASALTYEKHVPGEDLDSSHFYGIFPESAFDPGLSPLWYSAALLASALVLASLYSTAPARRPRHQTLVAALASAITLCFLPAADHSLGPVTTAEACSPPESWEPQPPPPTGERAFVCLVRRTRALPFADTTPDHVVIEHGHRLCGVYTRDDPQELARVRAVEGLDVRGLTGALADICPSAAAEVEAQSAEEEREFEEFQAEERRKCGATPHHKPLVRPAKAIRLKEPEWPEASLGMYDENSSGEETFAKSEDNGLVGSGPGFLTVRTHSDHHICVTLETYPRRPPVETKGWDHVVEAGYHSTTGEMVFMDGLSGTTLPDLSLNGRKGHYRVRVHFAWFPWKGEKYGTQRLLIMAYPGNGDQVVTYRKPTG